MSTPTPQPGGESDDWLNQIIQGAMVGAGGASSSQAQIGWKYPGSQVYMGPRPTVGAGAAGAVYVPYEEAALVPLSWSDNQLRRFVNTGILNHVPGFDVNMGMPEIQNAWMRMVDASILFNSRNTQLAPGQLREGVQGPSPGGRAPKAEAMWSPWDVLNSYSSEPGKFGEMRDGDWVYDVATGERIRYVGPTSRTTTSSRVNLSSPEEVQALTTQWLRELLGRAPNDQELAQFRASISNLEQETPEVTTTTQTLSPNLETGQVEVTGEESTTTGGISDAARAALIQEEAMRSPEYGKYQSGTTYWNAMMQMIAGG